MIQNPVTITTISCETKGNVPHKAHLNEKEPDNVFTFLLPVSDGNTEEKQLIFVIGLETPDRENVAMFTDVAYGLCKTMPNIVGVRFVPLFDRRGEPLTKGLSVSGKIDYATTRLKNEEDLTERWHDFKLDKFVLTGILPFVCEDAPSGRYSETITTNYQATEELKSEIRQRLSKTLGIVEDSVYVAQQFATIKDVFRDVNDDTIWNYFSEQADMKLAEGHSFIQHSYDTQTFPAGELNIPMYGIFVSVCMDLPSKVDVSAYEKFDDAFHSVLFDPNADAAMLSGVGEHLRLAGDHVYHPNEMFRQYNSVAANILVKKYGVIPKPEHMDAKTAVLRRIAQILLRFDAWLGRHKSKKD